MLSARLATLIAETAVELVAIPVMMLLAGGGLVFQALEGARAGWNDGETEGEEK